MRSMDPVATARCDGRLLWPAALVLGSLVAHMAAAQVLTASEPVSRSEVYEQVEGLGGSAGTDGGWGDLSLVAGVDLAAEALGGWSDSGQVVERTNGLAFGGRTSGDWSVLGTRMRASRISSSNASTVGPLQLRLWATTEVPVSGQTIYAWTLASYDLGYLPPFGSFSDVDTGWIGHAAPPSGCHYMTLALLRSVGGVYQYEDLSTFSEGGADDGTGKDRFAFGNARCAGADGSVNLVVPSTTGGRTTDLFVGPGDRIDVNAWGRMNSWSTEPGHPSAGPDGNGQACTSACPVPSSQVASLVARIAPGGPWFFVGHGGSFVADRNGTLEYAINDHYYPDNIGDFTVTTKVSGGGGGPCVETATGICLNRGRFRAEVSWRTAAGAAGEGRVAPQRSDDSGLFWFFNSANWEMLIKVLDGCGVNNRYWVFFAATTDVELTVRVVDTRSGLSRTYYNTLGHPANAVTDSTAFAACP